MGHAVKKIDAKPLRDLVRVHNLTIQQIAARTDISASALYTWEREGKMPGYMGAVCLGLLLQLKDGAPMAIGGTESTLIVRLPADTKQKEMVLKALDTFGAKYKTLDDMV